MSSGAWRIAGWGVESIGGDEIHWGCGLRAGNFLTVIYQIDQIDAHCRRLLWVGWRRSQATLRRGLKGLGPEVVQGLRFVCSDMGKAYLQGIAAQAGQALHVLDRFHLTSHLNEAVDQVRRAEERACGQKASRPPRSSSTCAGRCCVAAAGCGDGRGRNSMRCLPASWPPRAHDPFILNWLRARGEISTGAVEGLNNKIRVVTRRSYGFHTFDAVQIALYHKLGRPPEPESTHRFC